MQTWKHWVRRAVLVLIGVGLAGYSVGMGIYAVASTQPGVPSQPTSADEASRVLEQLGVADAYPFQNGFAETTHGRMHYAESGQGDPVLLLHGNPTWSFLYRHLLRDLGASHRVIAPDLIGFGLSEKLATAEAYSLEGHIEDVAELVESLDLDGVTVVMQDWGGPIGLGLWLRMPDRIRALVVMNTYGFDSGSSGAAPGPALALRALRAPLMGEQLVQGLEVPQRVFLRAALRASRAQRAERPVSTERASAGADPDQILDAYLSVQGSWPERAGALAFSRWLPLRSDDPTTALMQRARRQLALTQPPGLIIWGLRDPLLRSSVLDEWRSALPQARVVELEGVGHLPPEEAPTLVSAAVRQFLGTLPDDGLPRPLRQAGVPKEHPPTLP